MKDSLPYDLKTPGWSDVALFLKLCLIVLFIAGLIVAIATS